MDMKTCTMTRITVGARGESAWEHKSYYYAMQCSECKTIYPVDTYDDKTCAHCDCVVEKS
jgi:hypothetical protein